MFKLTQCVQQCQSLDHCFQPAVPPQKASSFEVGASIGSPSALPAPFLSLPVCLAAHVQSFALLFRQTFFLPHCPGLFKNMTIGHVRLHFLPISPDDSEKQCVGAPSLPVAIDSASQL